MKQNLTFREIVPFFESAVTSLGTKPSDIKKQDFDVFANAQFAGIPEQKTRKGYIFIKKEMSSM